MRLARLITIGTLVFSAGALGAQKPAATKAPTAKDSAKAMKKDASRKMAQSKVAKATGDTTKAKALKKEAKKEAKTAKAMKKSAATTKPATTKKP